MEQNIYHWLREVKAGRRPGYALVISGPQGSGKSTLTGQLITAANSGAPEQELGERHTSITVLKDGFERTTTPGAIKALITNDYINTPQTTTPTGVIIEVDDPAVFSLMESRRFFHIRLGA